MYKPPLEPPNNITFITFHSLHTIPSDFIPLYECSNKTNTLDCLNQTIHLNPFNTQYFMWIHPEIAKWISPLRKTNTLHRYLSLNKLILHMRANATFPPHPSYAGAPDHPFDIAAFGGHYVPLLNLLNMTIWSSSKTLENVLSFVYQRDPESTMLIQHEHFKRNPNQCSRLCI